MYVDCLGMETNQHLKNIEKQCTAHYKSSKYEHLVTLQNYESWKTMLEAAKLRNFNPILDIANKFSETQQSTTITTAEASSHIFKQNTLNTVVLKLQLIC